MKNNTLKYAFFDVDKTIYDGYSTPDFLKYLANEKIVAKKYVEKYLELDLKLIYKFISYNDIALKSAQLFAKAVKGKKEKEIQIYEDNFYQKQGRLFLWVPKILDYLQKNEYKIIFISATVEPILDTFTRYFRIEKYFGTKLEIKKGVFTGKVKKVINYEKKATIVNNVIKKLSNDTFKVGFGDSIGDIPMLSLMDKSFLINPKDEELHQIAKQRNWKLTLDPEEMIRIIEKS